MSPERLIGLAYACEHWHRGQFSKGYRLLCKIAWIPRTDNAARLLPRHEYVLEREWAAHYMRLGKMMGGF